MALQIYVYDEDGSKWELDLYEEEPLKLTISAEDIKDIPKVNSAFSKQFRIPATQNNSKVFKWWYEVNSIDFDITKRVSAEIYVDGLFYKSGHLRIQAAYTNSETSQIDLEVVFFGETRDFATQLSEKLLPELNLSDLNHELTLDNVTDSWDGGLHNGGVRYILADRGYTYDENGNVLEDSQIGFNIVGNDFPKSFSKNNFPLHINQMTPMIQVKRIIEAIFAQTDYTYSADSVFNEIWFQYLYTDGIPTASPTIDDHSGTFEATSADQNLPWGAQWRRIYFENEISDPSGSFYPLSSFYFIPENGTYTFNVNLNLKIGRSLLHPSPTYNIRIRQGGLILDTKSVTVPFGVVPYITTDTLTFSGALTKSGSASDAVSVEIQFQDSNYNNVVQKDSLWECVTAPTFISVSELLKYDVKCVDFLKGILTKFKLVMVPSKDNDFEFIIKPWVDYINSGEQFDWTPKLDNSKDTVLTPVFFDQSQIIDFTDQRDEDHHNKPFQQEYDRAYGALQFDSQNDLLKERKKIETLFAPTPICAVEGTATDSEFLIPYFSKLGDLLQSYNHLEHLPMRVKPRLLFWNGRANISGPPTNESWHLTDGTVTIHEEYTYPRMSPYAALPTTPTTLNLNWFRETPLFTSLAAIDGESVYERFWNSYIQQLYSPYSRILTAYFNLNSQDISRISFDDTVFIKNSWWRVIKIYDAPLSEIATVKVDLIKLLDVDVLINGGDPSPTGGGIDDVVVTGGGGGVTTGGGGFDWDTDINRWENETTGWNGSTAPVLRKYAIQSCNNPGDFFYAAYTSVNALLPGSAVKTSHDGGFECWVVITETATTPNTTVLTTFTDCLSCS